MTKGFAIKFLAASTALALLAGCDRPLDFDLRGKLGSSADTSDAARSATAERPRPDDRGIISYPNYQVAVAQRGDTLATLANRIGADPVALARYNGIQTGDPLRPGEIIALPSRVAEPSPATGALTTGPIQAPTVDITELAEGAIERAEPANVSAAPQPVATAQQGIEPIRHKVVRGETAYTVARLYNTSVRSLADWNGLDSSFSIREGQFLLIPTPLAEKPVLAKPADQNWRRFPSPASARPPLCPQAQSRLCPKTNPLSPQHPRLRPRPTLAKPRPPPPAMASSPTLCAVKSSVNTPKAKMTASTSQRPQAHPSEPLAQAPSPQSLRTQTRCRSSWSSTLTTCSQSMQMSAISL